MPCARCLFSPRLVSHPGNPEAGQLPIYGSARTCAFDDTTGLFTTDNWCCATLVALREVTHALTCNDQKVTHLAYRAWGEDAAGSIDILHVPEAVEGDDLENAGRIVLTRYKSRGRTDGAVLLTGTCETRPLSLALAEAVLSAYGETLWDDLTGRLVRAFGQEPLTCGTPA